MRPARCKVVVRYLATACYLLVVVYTVRFLFRDPCVEVPVEPSLNEDTRQREWPKAPPDRRLVDWTDEQPLLNFSNPDAPSAQPLTPPRTPCPSTRRHSQCVSDSVPSDRGLPDTRPRGCQRRPYFRDLPRTSLVVTSFASEHLSAILRGLHSIHRRTPTRIVHETIFILIPKASDTEKDLLAIEAAVTWHFPTLIMTRSASGAGLLGARKLGVDRSTAEVIAFIHLPAEVNINWLPPLLEPIAENARVVTTPVLDVINETTFEYGQGGRVDRRAGFDWCLEEVLFDRGHVDAASLRLPFATPVADNRLFCISRTQWIDIEGYNGELRPLGKGENIELSLKTWLCGGEVKAVPCSRVGVIPTGSSPTIDDVENYALVASGWMDEFGDFVLAEIGQRSGEERESPAVTSMKGRLICKPFRWYLEKILPELITEYPPYRAAADLGVIQSLECGLCSSAGRRILRTKSKILSLSACADPRNDMLPSWRLKEDGHLQLADSRVCLAVTSSGGAMYENCSGISPNQFWEYDQTSRRLTHRLTGRGMKATSTCGYAAFPKFYSNDKYSNSTLWQWQLARRKSELLPSPKSPVSSKLLRKRWPSK